MGVFTRNVPTLNAGESVTINAPAGKGSINKIYLTSANLTYGDVKTGEGSNAIPKATSTNYQEGFFPLQQAATAITVTVFGMVAGEAVTILAEWM